MKKNDVSAAIRALKEGDLILYPTDTLYALGADIYNETAVQKVFDIKQRPYSVPLPVAVSTIEAIDSIAWMNTAARRVCERFLPGKLTIILKKKPSVPSLVTSGLRVIAIRVPKNPIAFKLLETYGPLTVTSANIHQEKTQGTINGILRQLKASIPVCLHDGRKEGTASTIIDLSTKKPWVVREGSISREQLLDVITYG